jgi:O-antigen/teichoic acid export membrane protein
VRRLLVQLSLVSAASSLSEALYVVRGLALARLLGPEAFGVWASMRTVRNLAGYSSLGARAGMLQLAPLADGGGDAERARCYRGTAGVLSAAGSLLFALGVALLALAFRERLGAGVVVLWLGFAVVLVLAQLFAWLQTWLHSLRRFPAWSLATLGCAVLSTALGIPAAWLFGLEGFLAAVGVSHAAACVLGVASARELPRPAFDRAAARSLLGAGLRIDAASALAALQAHTDKLAVWAWLGTAALGVYALPSYVTAGVMIVPAAASAVVYPRLLAGLGRSREGRVSWAALEQVTGLLAAGAALALGFLALAFPPAVAAWLPGYADAVRPGLVLVLAAFFPAVGVLPATVLLSLGGDRALLAIRSAAVVATALAAAGALGAGGGLVAVACAAALGRAIQALATLALALRRAGLPQPRALRVIATSVGPWLALLGLLAATGDLGAGREAGSLAGVALRMVLVAAPLGAWTLLLLLRVRRQHAKSALAGGPALPAARDLG